jgi:hypothetical protein
MYIRIHIYLYSTFYQYISWCRPFSVLALPIKGQIDLSFLWHDEPAALPCCLPNGLPGSPRILRWSISRGHCGHSSELQEESRPGQEFSVNPEQSSTVEEHKGRLPPVKTSCKVPPQWNSSGGYSSGVDINGRSSTGNDVYSKPLILRIWSIWGYGHAAGCCFVLSLSDQPTLSNGFIHQYQGDLTMSPNLQTHGGKSSFPRSGFLVSCCLVVKMGCTVWFLRYVLSTKMGIPEYLLTSQVVLLKFKMSPQKTFHHISSPLPHPQVVPMIP